jgi:predicted extracellular nuclease
MSGFQGSRVSNVLFRTACEICANIGGHPDLDAVVKIDELERYTYLFDMNAQELDHMFVSPSLAKKSKAEFEHIHVNTWPEFAAQVSDHDPSVAKLDVCA